MDAVWLIPIAIVVLIVIGLLAFWRQATKANLDRYDGNVEAAMADNTTSIPATPLIPDNAELGDTEQAHDTLSPHDIPLDNPGRPAVEALAQEDGTTDGERDEDRSARFSSDPAATPRPR